MGIFNSIRNAYRSITGKVSVEDETNYRKETGYNGKITKASSEENLAVNLELQRRVYRSEGRLKEAAVIEQKEKPLLEKYQNSWNPGEPALTVYHREFKQTVLKYVRECFQNEVGVDKAKNIYNSLMESYKEVYKGKSSLAVLKLKNGLERLTEKALEKKGLRNSIDGYVSELYCETPKPSQVKIRERLKSEAEYTRSIGSPRSNLLEMKIEAARLENKMTNKNSSSNGLQSRREAYRRMRERGLLEEAA